MNIGDYVRTKKGIIGKINFIRESLDETLEIDIDNSMETILKKDIIKSSPNIIDLLEVGDIIICDNKKYAINYEFEVDYNNDYKDYEITIDDYITLFLKDGLSIVTKEQFESMKYKIGE